MKDQMKIKYISYGVTINMGNYESTRLELSTSVELDQKYEDVLLALKKEVAYQAKIIKKQGA